MEVPLLKTKLYIPQTRADLVPRPRLLEMLGEALPGESGSFARKLTLISAPAGFGKTTLLSSWIRAIHEGRSERAAWLALDEADNDPARFWAYFVAALRGAGADLGESVLGALHSPQPPPVLSILTSLINEIASLSTAEGAHYLLVLDDYHLVTTGAIHDALAFLIEHLPDNLHLVIASRADPPLPLARLRGRGHLTELRQADLRFTPEEAAAFLRQVSGLDLSAEEIVTLEERTEGWITGLQLAALSMRGRDDVAGFVAAFAGSHRYVLDYLTEEVLQRQPAEVRDFLLQTSILDRLSGPLCDAVLCAGDPEDGPVCGAFATSQEVLEYLEAANLFVVPLDDRRAWYRYHRLFADLLRARAEELYPTRVLALHRRASDWYEREELLDGAMKHAVAAGDLDRASEIVETYGRLLLMRGELITLLRWFDTLPPDAVRASARLCVSHAWALLLTGQEREIEPRLERAEQLLEAGDPLLGDVAVIRAYQSVQRGEVQRTIELANLALERLPSTKQGERGVAFFVLGGAYLLSGVWASAGEALTQAAAVGQQGENLHIVLPALNALAGIQATQGHLRRAQETAEQAIELVTGSDGRPLPIAAGAVSALAELAYEWNELDAALAYAQQSIELGRLWGNSDTLACAYLILADVLRAQGQLEEAREALHDAERLSCEVALAPTFFSWFNAARVQLWLTQGELAPAIGWAEDVTFDSCDVFHTEELLALVQVRLAQGAIDEATRILSPVVEMVQGRGLTSWHVEGLALQALVYYAQGDERRALAALAEALTLAEPEGYVRCFVDLGSALGPAMASLLQKAEAQGIVPGYVGKLLAAFDPGEEVPASPQAHPLLEPLSPRELEVLSLAAEGLSNREIGRRLHIAESTVKSHLNTVYGKLGVQNRTQAAAQAHALHIL